VPSYPRQLPLKIAEGVVVAPGRSDSMMFAYFDVAGGSSGAPVVLASDPRVIVGIVSGDDFRGRSATVCDPQHGSAPECRFQPRSPAYRIKDEFQCRLPINTSSPTATTNLSRAATARRLLSR